MLHYNVQTLQIQIKNNDLYVTMFNRARVGLDNI